MLALSSSSSRPGWRAAASLVAAVLVAHGLALDGMTAKAPAAVPLRTAMATRQISPAADVMPVIADVRVSAVQPMVVPLRPLQLPRIIPAAPMTRAVPPPTLAVALVESAPFTTPTTSASTGTAAAPVAESPPEAVAPEPPPVTTLPEVPVYPTRLPTAMTLRYALKRGPLVGQGTLSWRPDGRHYELVLEGSVAGLPVLKQSSAGQIDAVGIAPDRFTDQRLRRGTQAANFQRDKKLVSFSGSTASFALAPGSQDRLSWMLQLAGIVAAEPKRGKPGGQVSMVVVGVRGEADVWVFDFVAAEDVVTARGTVPALRFVREPRKPYDSKVEVWLDPARQFIPAHARFIDGETLDLLLLAADPGA